jgi:hypothetical protein
MSETTGDITDEAVARAATLHRFAVRKQPLPEGVTLVRLAGVVTALCADRAGVRVQCEADGPWLSLPVQWVRHPRRAHLVQVELQGQPEQWIFPYAPGDMGMADVGTVDHGGGDLPGSWYSTGDPWWVALFDLPGLVDQLSTWGSRRSAQSAGAWRAEQLCRQLRAALGGAS